MLALGQRCGITNVAIAVAISMATAEGARPSRPVVFVGAEELARLRQNVASGAEPFASAWSKLLDRANQALAGTIEVYAGADSVELGSRGVAAAGAVRDLCLAYEITKDARYGSKARAIIAAWATHTPLPGTGVSKEPYRGQKHGGSIAGLGLNLGLLATNMANAYSLAWPHLSEADRSAVARWFRFLATEIKGGHVAWIENDYYGKQDFNNHLSGHNMGLAAIGFALSDRELADYAIDSPANPRDWKEMHNGAILTKSKPDAQQLWHGDPTLTQGAASPEEGEVYDRYRVVTVREGRGCGMPYAFFHQKMLTLTAEMAFQNGIDLYRYVGAHGENLRLTYDAYALHLLKREPVARSGYYARNRVYEGHVHLYEIAARRYGYTGPVQQVLSSLNRVVFDRETFGWAAVLLYGDSPRLFFTSEDIPSLRTRTQSGVLKRVFDRMRSRADTFLSIPTDPYALKGGTAGRAMTVHVLELALTAHLTGERRYADKAVEILCAVARQNSADTFAKINDALAVGDALHALAVGYDWVRPFLTPQQDRLLRNEVEELGGWVYARTSKAPWGHAIPDRYAWNWNPVAHGGLGLAALALGGHENWLRRATERIDGYFKHGHDTTGASYESVHYLCYGMCNAMPFAVALARNGGPDLIAKHAESMRQVNRYLIEMFVPWTGSCVHINQGGGTPDKTGFMHLLASKFRDPVGQWAWLRCYDPKFGGREDCNALPPPCGVALPYIILWRDPGLKPQSPTEAALPLSRFFKCGQSVARNGWDDLAAMATFKASDIRALSWNHGDQNTFTFFAFGEEFAPDPGPHMIGSELHNTILIDGQRMTNHGGHHQIRARTLVAKDEGQCVHLVGEADGHYGGKKAKALKRRLLFGRAPNPYLLVVDDADLDGAEHDYVSQLFTARGNKVDIASSGRTAVLTGVRRGAHCDVHVLWPPAAKITRRTHKGYYRNPLLGVEARAVNPRFVVLLCARDIGAKPAQVSMTGAPGNMEIAIRCHDGTTDIINLTECEALTRRIR